MEYKTKDFYLAVTLKAKGYKFIRSEKHGENTVFFIFELNKDDESDLRQVVDDFINMTAEVNVRKFTWAMSDMRDELNKYKNIQFKNKK